MYAIKYKVIICSVWKRDGAVWKEGGNKNSDIMFSSIMDFQISEKNCLQSHSVNSHIVLCKQVFLIIYIDNQKSYIYDWLSITGYLFGGSFIVDGLIPFKSIG